mgnify:CR=1 FL=1
MEVLVAGFSFDVGHGGHPEVVEERSDDTKRAIEADFDLEA